ncbi:MAG TPA: SpoIID/LytB domain-containing protein [Solirubrobacteraceae bacterium]|nr:SpoIID/LytB domain-containing protein [Solirubrobacteraceae bacterium]
MAKVGAGALLTVLASLAMCASSRAASEVFIRGAGYGHGVGMSQYGAYGYALAGRGYRSILAHYYTGTSLATVDPQQVVTVEVATGVAAFTGATRAADKKLAPGVTYDVRALASGRLRLVERGGKRGGKPVGTFAPPVTVTGPGPLTVPGLGAYRGALTFRRTGSGRVETINAVGLDDYVRGVVASEMPSGWPMPALEAQAVAARTYAITTDAGGSAFDQYSDTRSQVYGGVGAETPPSDAAVAATAGQVVTYAGRPAVTYFFSSSGGRTENDENVFLGSPPDPWLRGVSDPYDSAGGNPHHRWRLRLSLARAASKLRRLVDGGLIGIKVSKHGVSPRIVTAAVVGTRGTRPVTGPELERRFGLRSSWAAFTTITTMTRRVLPLPATKIPVAALAMPLPLVRAVIARVAVLPDLVGTVFPGRRGELIAVQARTGGTWHTVRYARLLSAGSYAVPAPRPGTYRILYEGLDGPVVTL